MSSDTARLVVEIARAGMEVHAETSAEIEAEFD